MARSVSHSRVRGNALKEVKGMEKDKGKGKGRVKEMGPMEGIKDKREGKKSPLHRLHFEVRPNAAAAGIVTSFNTPAQREGIERYKEMS